MEDDGLPTPAEVAAVIEQVVSRFAWSWVVAYLTARQSAGASGRRYKVKGRRDDRSPTGWRWTWEKA